MSLPVLDGYSDLVEINHGGSSTIYSAFDERHNRKVAIKVLTFKSLDATTLESLQRELRAMGLLGDHPHIMSVHNSGLTPDGSPFMVMPLFTEGSYTRRVGSQGPLGWVEVADIGVKLCSALETAHRSSVLHRDIKPDNIFTGHYRTHPVLGDFGISTLDNGENSTTNGVAYTLKYAAPEVIEGHKQTKSSDIYSLGATFRYLLAGVPAYSGASNTALIDAILNGNPQPLPMGLPPELVELLDSMIDRDPGARPSTCLDIANRLREIQTANGQDETALIIKERLAEQPAPVPVSESTTINPNETQKLTPTQKHPVAPPEATDTSDGGTTQTKPKRRRWLIGTLATAAALALLAVTLINITKTDTPETASPKSPTATEPTPTTQNTTPTENTTPTKPKTYEPTIFEGHESSVLSVTGLADGRIASASEDVTIRIWDSNDPNSTPEVFDSGTTWSMQGLADGRIISGTIDSKIQVWNPAASNDDPIVFSGHTGVVRSVTIMSGNRIASGGQDGTVRVWNLNDPTAAPILFNAHGGIVMSVIELPGNRIASAGLDGAVKIWDLNQPGAVHTSLLNNPGAVSSLVATDDGRIAIGSFNGDILLRDPDDLEAKPTTLRGHVGAITALDIMKDGRIISGSVDGIVRVWDLNEEVPDPIVLESLLEEITSVTRFGDNQVAAGSQSGIVATWDLSKV